MLEIAMERPARSGSSGARRATTRAGVAYDELVGGALRSGAVADVFLHVADDGAAGDDGAPRPALDGRGVAAELLAVEHDEAVVLAAGIVDEAGEGLGALARDRREPVAVPALVGLAGLAEDEGLDVPHERGLILGELDHRGVLGGIDGAHDAVDHRTLREARVDGGAGGGALDDVLAGGDEVGRDEVAGSPLGRAGQEAAGGAELVDVHEHRQSIGGSSGPGQSRRAPFAAFGSSQPGLLQPPVDRRPVHARELNHLLAVAARLLNQPGDIEPKQALLELPPRKVKAATRALSWPDLQSARRPSSSPGRHPRQARSSGTSAARARCP